MSVNAGQWLYVGRAKDPGEPWATGDIADAYPALGDLTEFRAEPRDRGRSASNPHELARREATLLEQERDSLRVVSQTGCTCRRRSKSLAAAYVRAGALWVWVAPQIFPAAVRDETLDHRQGKAKWWPAHREPSGIEHTEVATCRHCRRHWAVMIREDGYRVVALGSPTFGVVVQ